MTWHIQSILPNQEPNLKNMNAYLQTNLIHGSSPDAQFIFDAIYSIDLEGFVLTLMQVDNEMGFIEKEKRLLLKTRAELLEAIENYQINPLLMLTDEHEHMEIYRG
ncbi:hypothetical protein [Simonsiella muelleri]|uniref:hypothetical protein n=1 Tax=Simonsiella muelleri TaxID=72 RepID=UPI0028D249A7|nr:hypothetical protein [Simonsiella muelleri]